MGRLRFLFDWRSRNHALKLHRFWFLLLRARTVFVWAAVKILPLSTYQVSRWWHLLRAYVNYVNISYRIIRSRELDYVYRTFCAVFPVQPCSSKLFSYFFRCVTFIETSQNTTEGQTRDFVVPPIGSFRRHCNICKQPYAVVHPFYHQVNFWPFA